MLDLGVGGAAGGEVGGPALDSLAHLDQGLEQLRVLLHHGGKGVGERVLGQGADIGAAALARFEKTHRLKHHDRFADRGPADPEHVGHVPFGGNAFAGLELAGADQGLDLRDDFLGDLFRTNRFEDVGHAFAPVWRIGMTSFTTF